MTVETALPWLKEHKNELLGLSLPEWAACEKSLQSERLLENGRERSSTKSNDKRKTDKLWILLYSHSLSVTVHQLLKPPCTERYAQWCKRTGLISPSYYLSELNIDLLKDDKMLNKTIFLF